MSLFLSMGLTKYKTTLRELRITHQQVADYTGHTRENVTMWLNGRIKPPIKATLHISEEIEEMIEKKKSVW